MGKRLIIVGADFSANAIGGESVTYYGVSYSLSNATASNTATRAAAGSRYTVTITADSGYELQSVTVTHNGQAVSPSSGQTYTIASVAGPISVSATAVEQGVTPEGTYLVTQTLTRAESSYQMASATAGQPFRVTLTPATGCNGLREVTVTHNGQAVAPTSGYTYDIASVAGPIVITATGCMTYTTANATLSEGYVVCETTGSLTIGEIVENVSYGHTNLLPCSGFGTLVSIHHPKHAALFYDSNQQPLIGWLRDVEGNAATEETTTIPAGAAYVRCNTFDASLAPASEHWHVTLY